MPRAAIIPIGRQFARLTTVHELPRGRSGKKPYRRFHCSCECGQFADVRLEALTSGTTKSCGCLNTEARKAARPPLNLTHGFSRHDGTALPEYKIWQAMKDRCLNSRNKFYSYYGGRGITVAKEWQESFPAFLEHIGRRPMRGLELDRIDNNRGYEPGNVRWATKAQQLANRRPYRLKAARIVNRLKLVLFSAPRTKKTSNRVFHIGPRCSGCKRGNRAVVQPSEAWTDWCNRMVPMIKSALPAGWKPIDFPVNCAALFYQDVDRADACGLYQGLADVLQHAGVIENDRWIRTWDGSLPLKDAANPRVELVLTRKDLTR